MSEKQKRSVLSLEVKQFIIKTKKNNPQMSSRQLAEEMLLKFDIKTSKSVICRTLKSRDDIMSLKMENEASKKENICCLRRDVISKNVFNKKFDFITVKNSEIFQVLKSEKNTIVYVAKKGWLNNMIMFGNEKT